MDLQTLTLEAMIVLTQLRQQTAEETQEVLCCARGRRIYCWGLRLLAILALAAPTWGQDIVAHRGASADAPENTLAAFRLAWDQKADAIEGDFYLTRDQRIVCFHDRDAKRITGVDRRISGMTFAEIRALDAGRWKDPKWTGAQIPTLTEVLASVPEDKYLLIEIKCGPEIVSKLKTALAHTRLKPAQTRVIAFDKQVVAEVKRQLPQLKAYWLVGYKEDEQTGHWKPNRDEVLNTLEEIHADGLDTQGNRAVVDADFARAVHERGLELHVWTIDDPDDARYFQRLGVASITTNQPAQLRQSLQREHVQATN
jgi:glycerophosphoryl diester phosphodiesterase